MGKSDEESEKNDDNEENKKNAEEKESSQKKTTDDGKKEDVESLRKVIKVDSGNDKKDEDAQKETDSDKDSEDKKDEEEPTGEELGDGDSRESLEQKRAILQNIKDFDFQIKKNQEDLSTLNQKLEAMSKDLDDLVSLYEIVSEQMNPFVGISSVTKKRLDALENFTREIGLLKERTNELESFAERSGAKLKTIDMDKILPEESIEEGETNEEITEEEDIQVAASDEPSKEEAIPQPEMTVKMSPPVDPFLSFTDSELDSIIEKSFGGMSIDKRIDMVIDDFIENLKG